MEFLSSQLPAIAYGHGAGFVVSTLSDGLVVRSQAATFQRRRLFALTVVGVLGLFSGALGRMRLVLRRFIHVEHLAEYVPGLFSRVCTSSAGY